MTRVIRLAADGSLPASDGGGEAERSVVVVPGAHVIVHGVDLPARTGAQARAAIPFLLAEEVGAPAATQHFALGPRQPGSDRRRAAVVARERMEAWMRTLADAGIEADAMFADHALIAAAPGTAVLLDLGEHVAFAGGDGLSCTLPRALLPELLGPLLARTGADRVELHGDGADDLAPHGGWGDREVVEIAGDVQEFLWIQAAASKGPGLLSGPYGRSRDWRATLAPWRRAAMLAAALPVLFLAGAAIDLGRHERGRLDALDAAEALFRQAVPEAGRTVNPRAQIDAALAAAEARAGGDFLGLAAILFEAVEEVEGGALASLRFEAGRGVLRAELTHAAHEDLDRLGHLVEARGGTLAKGSSRAVAGGITSELELGKRR